MATRRWNATGRLVLVTALALPLAGGCASAATRAWPSACRARCRALEGDSVNVGYGLVRRRDLAVAVGSVVVRPGDASGIARVEELLDGRIPGVEVRRVGGEYAVRIRGGGSPFANGGEPLYVVDGVPFPRGVSARALVAMLDPGDVARVDVLKDAGATAAYGARGANGVVLITTRRGPR